MTNFDIGTTNFFESSARKYSHSLMVQLSKTKAQELTVSAPFLHVLDEILGEYGLVSTNLHQSAVRK